MESAVLGAVVEMGRSLGLEVLAEGVEDATQHEALRRRGCDLAQGYFYSRPLPPERLVEVARAEALEVERHVLVANRL